MIALVGESLKRTSHGDTLTHTVFYQQVLLPLGWFSPRHINKCVHFRKIRDELGRTFQKVEFEQRQWSASAIEKYEALTEEQMERRAKARGLLAPVSTTNDGKKRMEFVNRDFNAAINIRRCAVVEHRPPEWTRRCFVGQPPKVELYEKKFEAVEGGLSQKTARHLHVSWLRFLQGALPLLLCTAGDVRLLNGYWLHGANSKTTADGMFSYPRL
jgi:hypothetical protein